LENWDPTIGKEELITLVSGSATAAIDNLIIEEFNASGPTANEFFLANYKLLLSPFLKWVMFKRNT